MLYRCYVMYKITRYVRENPVCCNKWCITCYITFVYYITCNKVEKNPAHCEIHYIANHRTKFGYIPPYITKQPL